MHSNKLIVQNVGRIFYWLLLYILFSAYVYPTWAVDINRYPALLQVVDEMTKQDKFQRQQVIDILSQAKVDPEIIKLMNRNYESLPWYKYQKIFINHKRIRNGQAFWAQHVQTLARAEKQFGVPAEFIVALIGVETNYGKHLGNIRVIDALVTLTADYPRRRKYFSSELKKFLRLIFSENLDPLSITGSFAGAVGIPQFMPSSYTAYSVDFNSNGVRDLVNETEDAIGSVANYLKEHGWQPNQAVFSLVKDGNLPDLRKLASGKSKPHLLTADIKKIGAVFSSKRASPNATVIRFELTQGEQYVVAFHNFYVITRYNTSNNYARVVTELATALRKLVDGHD